MFALVAAGTLLVAACSSDDDASSDTEAPAGTEAATDTEAPTASDAPVETDAPTATEAPDGTDAPTETDAPAEDGLECAGPAAEGDAVKVGVVWPEGPAINLPDLGDSATATAEYANECLGGIGGHPIEVVGCPIDETNPAGATECANQFIEEGAQAVAVTITAQGATLAPAVTDAGLPYIVSGGSSPPESIDATGQVFSVSGGVAASLGAMAITARDEGISKVALIVSENAAAGVGGLAGIPFANAGVEVEVVPVAPGTPDITPQVSAALSSGAGATAIIADATLCISYLQAVQAVDPDGEHWIITTCVGDEVVDAVGEEALDGAVLMGGADPAGNDPDQILFRNIMAEYSPDTVIGGFTGAGFLTMLSLVRGLEEIGDDVTAETITSTFRATADVPSPAGYGQTFGCSTQPLPPLTVCSGSTVISDMDGGTPINTRLIDAAEVFGS
jgi:branched-chain amino acid transport system substrate-binding protein